MDDRSRVFHALIRELLDSPEPYGLAAAVMRELLAEVDKLCRELESFLDDLVTLDRARQPVLPADLVDAFRRDLQLLGDLRSRWQLGALFSDATRRRCGIAAVPILAAALCGVEIWVQFARDWLDGTERIRIRADAERARLEEPP